MNISPTLPSRPFAPLGAPSTANQPQASGAVAQAGGNGSASQPSFARSLDRARSDHAAPPHGRGVFGSGTGGAYGPAGAARARIAKPDDSADGSTRRAGPPPPTGGPDVPRDNDPAPDPVSDPAAGATDKASTDKHAAPARPIAPPARGGSGGKAGGAAGQGAGSGTGSVDPQEAAGRGIPGAPLPCFPLDPVAGLPADADPGKEAVPIRQAPIEEEQEAPGGAPVECPIDNTSAMTAMLGNIRAANAAPAGAHAATGGAASDLALDTKGAAGGIDNGNGDGSGNGIVSNASGAPATPVPANAVRTADAPDAGKAATPLLPPPRPPAAAAAADALETRHAVGWSVGPGKNYSTEPVRNVDGDGAGANAEAGADAGKGFGAKLAAALGGYADAAQAHNAATSAAASTTPSAASSAPGATDGALLQGRLQGQLLATPGSADFAPQLGAQISTFIREGVHHARLELNPAEMGPLTVQIKLDGLSASVNMAAQHIDTRHALEQAMPQLASTLREAGLTLSGGGVSEQPQQAQAGQAGDGDRQASNRRASGSATDGANNGLDASREERRTLATPVMRQRGMVDLVA